MALQLGGLTLRQGLEPLISGLAVGGSIAGGVLLGVWLPLNWAPNAEHKLCDRAVATLLHSKELIEVERAGIIIRQANCGIGQRLTGEE